MVLFAANWLAAWGSLPTFHKPQQQMTRPSSDWFWQRQMESVLQGTCTNPQLAAKRDCAQLQLFVLHFYVLLYEYTKGIIFPHENLRKAHIKG